MADTLPSLDEIEAELDAVRKAFDTTDGRKQSELRKLGQRLDEIAELIAKHREARDDR